MNSICKIIIIILLIPSICFGLTETQKDNIFNSYEISKQFGFEDIIPALTGIESSFGLFKIGDGGKALGVTQIHFKTAKWWLKKQNIIMSDNNLELLLFSDNDFNVMVACSYYGYLLKKLGDKRKAILAYNVGLNKFRKKGFKFDPNGYLKKFDKYKIIVNEVMKGKENGI